MPAAAPRQLAFGFPANPSLARADFVPADCNRLALAWLSHQAAWPSLRLVLSGPPGSGKTHLAAIFAQEQGAPVLEGPLLPDAPAALAGQLAGRPAVVVEAAEAAPERALLHLLNMAAEAGARVLLTARAPAPAWGTRLADLRSRLAASGAAALGLPDEALLRAVLAKAAADRQLRLAPAVLDWLAARLPRDLAAATRAVAALDAASLAAGRAPDTRLARVALGAGEIGMTGQMQGSPGTPPLL